MHVWISGWLEPLHDRVRNDANLAVAPCIPPINVTYFTVPQRTHAIVVVGGFDITIMNFQWDAIPQYIKDTMKRKDDPVKYFAYVMLNVVELLYTFRNLNQEKFEDSKRGNQKLNVVGQTKPCPTRKRKTIQGSTKCCQQMDQPEFHLKPV